MTNQEHFQLKDTDIKKVVRYWKATAKYDYETMTGLFKIKRYPESLFFGHMLLEKILKALAVQITGKQAPYIHDLVKLQKLAKIDLLQEDKDLLYEVNEFNIRARYPDIKMRFHKICTRDYVKKRIDKISGLYKELCQKAKQKK